MSDLFRWIQNQFLLLLDNITVELHKPGALDLDIGNYTYEYDPYGDGEEEHGAVPLAWHKQFGENPADGDKEPRHTLPSHDSLCVPSREHAGQTVEGGLLN